MNKFFIYQILRYFYLFCEISEATDNKNSELDPSKTKVDETDDYVSLGAPEANAVREPKFKARHYHSEKARLREKIARKKG